MVNVPGRSKGCAICRKRKVKCDQLLPECQQCLDMGVSCPGPRTGAFFVHTLPDRHPPPAIANWNRNEANATLRSSGLPGSQLSHGAVFDQFFVSHFIETFLVTKPAPGPHVPSATWLDDLPSFLASPVRSPVQHAIRAASMMSYGTLKHDAAIRTEACRWYSKALWDLRSILSRDTVAVTEDAVCAAVMLTHFETWSGTRPRAWLPHIKGATRMIETMGPASCRRGFMHHLFSHMRLQAFVASMSENALHVFASHDWMTVPFEVHPKMMFDHLVDILFSLQKCLAVADRLIKSTKKQTTELETLLSMLIKDSISQSELWIANFIPIGSSGEANLTSIRFENSPMAALVALYDATSIVLLRLLFLVSETAVENTERIRRHVNSILSADKFINTRTGSVPDRGTTIMVLQLKVASLWSPFIEQREMALSLLQGDRVQTGGFADISTATPEYFSDVATFVQQKYPLE